VSDFVRFYRVFQGMTARRLTDYVVKRLRTIPPC
jgi:hypothetical protein